MSKILIADEESLAFMLKVNLERSTPYEFEIAKTVEEAVDKFSEGGFSAVVTGMNFGEKVGREADPSEKSGVRTVKAIREINKEIPILSIANRVEDENAAIEAGAEAIDRDVNKTTRNVEKFIGRIPPVITEVDFPPVAAGDHAIIRFRTVNTGSGYNVELIDNIDNYTDRLIKKITDEHGDISTLTRKRDEGELTEAEAAALERITDLSFTSGERMMNLSCVGIIRSVEYVVLKPDHESEGFKMEHIEVMLDCFGHMMSRETREKFREEAEKALDKKGLPVPEDLAEQDWTNQKPPEGKIEKE